MGRSSSGALTLQVDRRPESWLPFFDAEGSVLEATLPLIENGVLCAAQRIVHRLRAMAAWRLPRRAALMTPALPLGLGGLPAHCTDTFLCRAARRSVVYPDRRTSGGDMTPAGDFATPVQTAYLCRDGPPVGRLPEFSFRGSVFDLLGGGFLGRTDGGPLGGDGWTLLEGTIDA